MKLAKAEAAAKKAKTKKTVNKRFLEVMALKEQYVAQTPETQRLFVFLERHYNNLAGFGEGSDTLPARFLREGRACDPLKRTVPLETMLDEYYHLRGFDNRGIPLAQTLSRLGLNA